MRIRNGIVPDPPDNESYWDDTYENDEPDRLNWSWQQIEADIWEKRMFQSLTSSEL